MNVGPPVNWPNLGLIFSVQAWRVRVGPSCFTPHPNVLFGGSFINAIRITIAIFLHCFEAPYHNQCSFFSCLIFVCVGRRGVDCLRVAGQAVSESDWCLKVQRVNAFIIALS